jgi:TP901 family phage tail tape measure protein
MASLGTVSYGLQLNGVRSFLAGTKRATGGAAALNKALLGVTAATAGTAMALKGLADAAGDFQQGLAAVGAVTKATAADMQLLKDAAIQAGVATQFSPQQAVSGLQSLATAGQTATQAAKTLIPVLNLTAGSLGQLDTAGAGMAVVGTLNTYGMAANRAAEVTDKLLRITQLTNFQTGDFEVGLAKAAAKSNVFGQSLDDTLVVMGLLRNANIDASSAATAYTMAVQRVATDTKALNTMNKLGVSLYDKQTGATRGFMDLITELKPKMDQLGDAARNKALKDMFGARAIAAYNAVAGAQVTVTREGEQVVLRGADAIEHLRTQMSSASGVSKEFTDALLNTYQGQKQLLAGSIDTLKVVAGEEFANAFKPFVANAIQGINDLLETLRSMTPEAKRELAEQIIGYVELGAKIAAAGIAMKALVPIIRSVNNGLRAMAAAQAAVQTQGFAGALSNMASKANPVAKGLFNIGRALISVKVGAVAAAGAVAYAANKSFNTLKQIQQDTKLIEKIRAGTATQDEINAQRVGQSSRHGNMQLFVREQTKVGQKGAGKAVGGRRTSITSTPIDTAASSYEQLAVRLRQLTNLQNEMVTIHEKGLNPTLQGVVTEQGRVTKAYEISMESLEKRIVKVRKAHDAMLLAEADMGAATQVLRQPGVTSATEAALTGASAAAPAASGWTEAEMRAQAARKQFEQELAAIRQAKLDERLAREKAFIKEMDAARSKAIAVETSGTTDMNKAYLQSELKRDKTLGMSQQETKAYNRAQQAAATQQNVGRAMGAAQGLAGGNLGGAIASAIGPALGPVAGGALMAFDMLAGMSEEGRAFKEQLSSMMGKLAETLGPVFTALSVVLSVVMDSLKPALMVLSVSFAAIGAIVMTVVIAFREFYIFLLRAIDALPFVDLGDQIDELMDVQDAEIQKRNDLVNGIDREKEATEKNTKATEKATSSLLNIPQGIKVAAARFAATAAGEASASDRVRKNQAIVAAGGTVHNDFLQRPGQAATKFSPDDTIIGVKDPSSLGGSGTIILQNVHINANDPTAFFRNLLDLVNRDHKRGGQALGGMYQGRP